MLEANNEDEGGDLVPNLDLEGTFMTQLDEPSHLPSSVVQTHKHVQSGDSDTDPLSHHISHRTGK